MARQEVNTQPVAGPDTATATPTGGSSRRRLTVGVAVLAALAYIPTLLSAPDRMPADTKLGLYLDPQRLVSDAPWTFDARQFAGWVPHQTIAYAWPSGPWYVVADAIGLPDWIAHRLWLGTLLVLAGCGVLFCARRLGTSLVAALAAALLYQLSPYVVPYVSRTSSMLLPWVGLGWIVGLTVGAALRTRWRDAALCALVVGTVGAVNATALAMIAPAPVIWLGVAAIERRVGLRRALAAALRIGALSLLTSAWWLTMSVVQGRNGADVLAYSEALRDVSYTATAAEGWRALGYWLMYIRDPYAPTTTGGGPYLTDVVVVVAGYGIAVVGVLGLTLTRFAARRFAVLTAATGLALAIGLHPIESPSPLARLLTDGGTSGLALALRSSTRALPLLVLGLGLGVGALVDALAPALTRRRPQLTQPLRLAGLAAVAVVAIVNLPMVTAAGFVDPALERDQDPPQAWRDAAAALDAGDVRARVWQLPGAEFGAFRWGYTVDPPLPWLTERPLITRDLLPLGSPAATDLAFAADDRFQVGIAEAAWLAPIARLLGVDTIWVSGDAAFDRFDTPSPELTSDFYANAVTDPANGLTAATAYGDPAVNIPDIPMLDETAIAALLGGPLVGNPVAPVELVHVADPQPVIRVTAGNLLVSGSGDGVIDAAAAGLIDGTEAIRYSASLDADALAAAVATADALVVTDSNRQRAHHWRSSQEVTGMTEDGRHPPVITADGGAVVGDARLPLFTAADGGGDGIGTGAGGAATLAIVEGPVFATASGYGEPFSYQPEQRPVHAVDGDPATAWTVLDHRGQFLELQTSASVDGMVVRQPDGAAGTRHLISVQLEIADANGVRPRQRVDLDARSFGSGQPVEFDPTTGPTTVRLHLGDLGLGTPGVPPGIVDLTPVGFSEVDLGLGPSHEVVVTPTDLTGTARALAEVGATIAPTSFVLTRERVDPTDRHRSDPEPALRRRIDVPTTLTLTPSDIALTVRLDRRADDAVLARLLGVNGGPRADRRLTGVVEAAGWHAADGDLTTAWTTPFQYAAGSTLTVELTDPAALTLTQPLDDHHSPITALTVTQGAQTVTVPVAPAADGTSQIALPDGFTPGRAELTIATVEPRLTRDRRRGHDVVLPAAVSELGGVTPTGARPETFTTGCRSDLLTIAGTAVAVEVSGTLAAARRGEPLQAVPCGALPVLAAGTHDVVTTPGRHSGLTIDRVVLGSRPDLPPSPGAVDVVATSRTARQVLVPPCPDGCWLVLGEGYNTAWTARLDATTGIGGTASTGIGEPQLFQGGFNGWWLTPSADQRAVTIVWTAQAPVTAGIVVSILGVVLAVALALTDRRATALPAAVLPALVGGRDRERLTVVLAAAAAALLATVALVATSWWPLGAALGAAILVARRVRLAGLVAAGSVAWIGMRVAAAVLRHQPAADADFPRHFESLHHLGQFAVVALALTALAGRRQEERGTPTPADRRRAAS